VKVSVTGFAADLIGRILKTADQLDEVPLVPLRHSNRPAVFD